jgi:RNA polymerase-binding transcription factor DksA
VRVSLSAVHDESLDDPTITITAPAGTALDLDAIETDLADVEIALARLESGEYWTCEVTGQPLSDELLAVRPTARRAPGHE